MKRIGIVLLLCMVSALLVAEISPDSYQWMQDSAPEQLYITVLDVSTPFLSCFSSVPVTILAEVIRIQYSETGLEAGDEITITYSHYTPGPGWVGPRPVPILIQGDECPAFLQYVSDTSSYIPAAGGYSFEFLSYEGMF